MFMDMQALETALLFLLGQGMLAQLEPEEDNNI
jgi:hypothetical protein